MTPSVLSSPSALAAATPITRDRYLDFLRVFSIGVVVLGHWLMLTITLSNGRVQVGNILATVPAARLLTWVFQVMPLFFFVGGAAHAAALKSLRARGGHYPEFVASRLRRLLAPTAVFLAIWAAIAAGTELAGAQRPGSIATLMTHTVTQPLWFLGVYLGVVALAPVMHAAHQRWGAAVPTVLVLAAAGVDLAPDSCRALNVAFVWLAVHQMGFLYADGRLTRRVSALMAATGLAATVLLTAVTGWYPISMVGLPGAPVSNMNPPTLALVTHAGWLLGLLMLVKPAVTGWLGNQRVWTAVVAANGVVMTVFLWHLTALFALAGAWLAVDGPLPTPAGPAWWLLRPFWVALLIALLAPLVAAVRRFERPSPRVPSARHRARPTTVDTAGAGIGAALATLGLLIVPVTGLNGLLAGRTATLVVAPVTALAGLAALGLGWALVRASQR
jgi:hypothetical protein